MDSLDSLSCDLTRESSPGFRRRDKRSTRNENPGRDDTRGVRRVRGVRLIRGKMAMPAERNFDRGRLDECQSTMAILFTGLPMDLKDASRTSYRYGGIIPTIASEMHRQDITTVCEDALKSANLRLRNIDAIATTTKPGLPLSLTVGNNFGKYLSRIGNKPYIPIHHMEAHALTVRMVQKVDFPYLVLLVSGGHSLLAIVENVDKFYILGTTVDNAPGEVLDKIARRLKLATIPEFSHMSGGQAIESAASKASDPTKFVFDAILTRRRDCQFSFAGISNRSFKYIDQQEKDFNVADNTIIPDVYNFCAALQLSLAKHICLRTQRAMEFINNMNLISQEKRTLVISGGVACNNFLAKALEIVCSEKGFKFVRTPPRLCNDNGIMIAWNGAERWMVNAGVLQDREEIEMVTVEKNASFGESWIERVQDANIKCKLVKLNGL